MIYLFNSTVTGYSDGEEWKFDDTRLVQAENEMDARDAYQDYWSGRGLTTHYDVSDIEVMPMIVARGFK